MLNIANIGNHWHLRNRKFVGYVRGSTELDLQDQFNEIETYAREHGLTVTGTYCDEGLPGAGLRHAMEALEMADGMLVCNASLLSNHQDDHLRDLRPILHHFCSRESGGKHLICIEDGVDTSTPAGQMVALEMINELKDPQQL